MSKAFFLFLFCTAFAVTTHAQKPFTVLNHIAVYVQDLKQSEAFYQQVLRLDTIPNPFRDGKHTWFKIGQGQLHLIQGATGKPTIDKNSHLCFAVTSIDTLIATLQTKGIAFEDWPGKKNAITTRPDGVKQIYFQDPDGYWIEVNNDYR